MAEHPTPQKSNLAKRLKSSVELPVHKSFTARQSFDIKFSAKITETLKTYTSVTLVVTSATLVVTGALLVVTMFAIRNKCIATSNKGCFFV